MRKSIPIETRVTMIEQQHHIKKPAASVFNNKSIIDNKKIEKRQAAEPTIPIHGKAMPDSIRSHIRL